MNYRENPINTLPCDPDSVKSEFDSPWHSVMTPACQVPLRKFRSHVFDSAFEIYRCFGCPSYTKQFQFERLESPNTAVQLNDAAYERPVEKTRRSFPSQMTRT